MEQKKILNEDELPTFLEGMGFEADEEKQGLFKKKILDGATAFWDFRKTQKGNFYVTDAFEDGGEFWKDKDAKQLSEYVEVRKALGGEEKKKPEMKEQPLPSSIAPSSTSLMIKGSDTMRGTEMEVSRLMDTKLQLDSIIAASEDKDKPGEGLLWHELVFGKKTHKEPSVELVDMIAQDMGHITTRIVDFNMNTLEDPNTHKKYLTYYCVVEAVDGVTKTSGLGAAEQIIDFNEIEHNGRTFARTNAIRKAERNAKERMIPIPRRALVELVIRKLEGHQKKGA
jgi:hypothetical protein